MTKMCKKYFEICKKRLVGLLFCLGLTFTLVLCIIYLENNQVAVANTEITNWGLSFQSQGVTPIANASKEFLAQYDSFFVGNEESKVIYLTFDSGFENGYTADILDTLKKHNVKATFFLVGNYLETEPELVKRMEADGHIVGNHTWSHPDMSKIQTEEDFGTELKKVEDKYREITGKELYKIYRPPQGKYCTKNLQMAKDLGYHTAFWSLAYVDWYQDDQPTCDEAFEKLIPRIHNGSVVLLHSTSKTNCEILDELLTKWEELGYSFGVITDLCI